MKFKVDIKHWVSDRILASEEVDLPENATEGLKLGAAAREAIRKGARLDGASLIGARLDGASLIGARLIGARLIGARLDGARLDGASLIGARLIGARLDGARLDGARLDGARLDGASLIGARLDGARLDGASQIQSALLEPIRNDLRAVLLTAVAEAPELLAALRDGQIDGTVYRGECACLVGTIANIRGVDVESLDMRASRPAERWFLAIREGHTPEDNPIAAITAGWIEEFIADQAAA